MTRQADVTEILADVGRGDPAARSRLLDLIYHELHRLASSQMRGERPDHTLQPTALVHEAYMRLMGATEAQWESRAHFFGAAAEAMRRILIDHARARLADKRGAGRARVPFADMADEGVDPTEMLAIDAALTKLEASDPEQARLVKLRFFSGLTLDEIAAATGVSVRTVKRHWRFAKAWLYREISGHEPAPDTDRPDA